MASSEVIRVLRLNHRMNREYGYYGSEWGQARIRVEFPDVDLKNKEDVRKLILTANEAVSGEHALRNEVDARRAGYWAYIINILNPAFQWDRYCRTSELTALFESIDDICLYTDSLRTATSSRVSRRPAYQRIEAARARRAR